MMNQVHVTDATGGIGRRKLRDGRVANDWRLQHLGSLSLSGAALVRR
jgi:hypothetical protein